MLLFQEKCEKAYFQMSKEYPILSKIKFRDYTLTLTFD